MYTAVRRSRQVTSSQRVTVCVVLCCCWRLTVTRQLGHGRHEGTGTHVTLELLWDRLLWGGVELLLERDWLEGSEPASNVVDDGDGLRLRRRQTCE